MSASREKKQRQGAGLSEKALKAQQEQAARKRKTVTYTVIGVVVAVLVVALVSWNYRFFGILDFFQAKTTAATVGETNLTAAEMSYYYYNAKMNVYYNELYYYTYFGLDIPGDNDVRNSETGQTYRDYYMETALRSAQESMALADEAKKNGHTEDEVKASLDAQIKRLKAQAASSNYSYSAYLKAMCGPYMSAGVYEKLYTRDLLASLIYNEKYDELIDGYTEADLKAYYDADDHADSLDTFEYSYLYFTPAAVEEKDKDGNARDEDEVKKEKEAALAEAKANAEAAKKTLEEALEKDPKAFEKDPEALEDDGGIFSDLAKEYELADNRHDSHVSVVGITSAISVLQDKLLSMKADDVELVENGESGYYVAVLHSRKLVQDPTKDVRHILARAETTTDAEGNIVAPTDQAWAAAKERIEAIQAEYEAGAKTEDSFAALANAKSDDGNGTTGGLYTKIDIGDIYVPEFLEWIFTDGRKVGDTGIVQHEAKDSDGNKYWGYHFIYLVGDNEPLWMRESRESLTAEDMSDWLEGLKGNYKAALADGADNIGR